MQLTNNFIFQYTESLHSVVNEDGLKFSAKVNYVIQKNLKNFLEIYQELDKERTELIQGYAKSIGEDGLVDFGTPENAKKAEEEYADLMNMKQDVKVIKFKLDDLGDAQLTPKQMEVLMFMIEDEDVVE